MARQETAGTIINRAAVEMALTAQADPFANTDESFTLLVGLLNAAGQELAELYPWQELLRPVTYNTTTDVIPPTANTYALPADYDRIESQTGWDTTNDVPVFGPLSPQDWAYLNGRDFSANTIYISYRIYQGVVEVYPETPPADTTFSFQYITRNWATKNGAGIDYCTETGDVVLLDPLLMVKFLKVKYYTAKGLPQAAQAMMEFENVLQNRTGNDNSAPILNASRNSRGFPYLSSLYNTPDTGYGGTP